MAAETQEKAYKLSTCISCGSCLEVCPQVTGKGSNGDFIGAAIINQVRLFNMNVVEMMYEGYGDNAAPDQDQLEKQGDPYLKKGWPKLDYIKSATLVP